MFCLLDNGLWPWPCPHFRSLCEKCGGRALIFCRTSPTGRRPRWKQGSPSRSGDARRGFFPAAARRALSASPAGPALAGEAPERTRGWWRSPPNEIGAVFRVPANAAQGRAIRHGDRKRPGADARLFPVRFVGGLFGPLGNRAGLDEHEALGADVLFDRGVDLVDGHRGDPLGQFIGPGNAVAALH